MSQNKFKIISIVLLVVIVLLLGYFTGFGKQNKDYSVVYLSTGEVYVGKLATYPQFALTDAYIFQAVKDAEDPNKSNFQLNPISEALWATKTMNINEDQVVFYGALDDSSKIGESLRNK